MGFGSRQETAKAIKESKEFREAYLWSYLKRHIPFQVRTMRTERDWNQGKAAEALGKGQSSISRYESPDYGKVTLKSLLEIAKGFDVGLLVKFVPYSRLLAEYDDVSFDALRAASPTDQFPEELEAIDRWAAEREDDGFWDARDNKPDEVAAAKQPSFLELRALRNWSSRRESKSDSKTKAEKESWTDVIQETLFPEQREIEVKNTVYDISQKREQRKRESANTQIGNLMKGQQVPVQLRYGTSINQNR